LEARLGESELFASDQRPRAYADADRHANCDVNADTDTNTDLHIDRYSH
jgi:hypothetical protein